MSRIPLDFATCVGVCALLVGGCESAPSAPGSPGNSASSAASAPIVNPNPAKLRERPEVKPWVRLSATASAVPIPRQNVENSVNPSHLPPYSGPSGVVEGVVRMQGDAPEDVPLRLPEECSGAREVYGRSYREGPGRTVADVMVAVTGYEGYVPAKRDVVTVVIDNCAFSSRTVSATYGQRIEVANIDPKNSYLPVLVGSSSTAMMVAVPKGDPVKLYPDRVGQYLLTDNMDRRWMKADVLVLKYSTHAITGLDGRFRIEGIPVGEVEVHAYLPSIDATVTSKARVSDGKATKVDLVLRNDKKPVATPSPTASASASPPRLPVIK